MAISTTNLEAHWKLEDVNDSHGSNTLTNNNSTTFTAGKLSNAATFVLASLQSLSIADNASLSFADEDLTLAFWVKMAVPASTQGVIGKQDANAASSIEYGVVALSSGPLRWWISDGATLTTVDSAINVDDTWQFVVCKHNPTTNVITIRMNGGTLQSTACTTGIQNSTQAFRMGGDNTALRYMTGQVDSASIWRRITSDAEDTELYNSGSGTEWPWTAAAYGKNVIRSQAVRRAATY